MLRGELNTDRATVCAVRCRGYDNRLPGNIPAMGHVAGAERRL